MLNPLNKKKHHSKRYSLNPEVIKAAKYFNIFRYIFKHMSKIWELFMLYFSNIFKDHCRYLNDVFKNIE